METTADVKVPERSALQLATALLDNEPIQVIDVRLPQMVAGGRVDLVPANRFYNILNSVLFKQTSLDQVGVDRALPIVTVCGRGMSSREAAHYLVSLGYKASSLHGGMAAWMKLVIPRDLGTTRSLDRLVQFDRVGKGSLGYLLVSDDEAFVIDPSLDIEPYIQMAAESGARIVGIADTHVHADYISGAPGLARALDVPYYLHPADAIYPFDGTMGRLAFRPLSDGETLSFGRCLVRALHTPGHTEGSLTYVVDERAAFTGDFLFVTSFGRPDIADRTAEWTEILWRSLSSARHDWPHSTVVYPAHYASARERRPGGSVSATFEDILANNEAFEFADGDLFARSVAERAGGVPAAYRKIKAVNLGLINVDESEAEELDNGRNQCALAR